MPENTGIREYLAGIEKELYVSVISKIEVLGYHRLSNDEKTLLELFFNSVKSDSQEESSSLIFEALDISASLLSASTLEISEETEFLEFLRLSTFFNVSKYLS